MCGICGFSKLNGNSLYIGEQYLNAMNEQVILRDQCEETSEEVIAESREAVHLRKEADVPVGVFLSDGIDSSMNAALFSENVDSEVKNSCMGYDRDCEIYHKETRHTKMMARK